ncbi:helix-turn-helix transcriptional regulator [Leptolyngbya sp. FACHB-261]|uniref:ArsR/SmtB family transcription factor n=1 Tax=Leptolyngbya sp. FACHB-261 TaxID=2692806 RepID=UPI001686CFF7|nr:metalloregulator ArsR/SmtB family transcription factor [Leptolyngbya sp. FACHB-261]MBD2101238.1 winged helix-turn-helix transcriptional regulator [Leptolyngbya sp. FACHB-261]
MPKSSSRVRFPASYLGQLTQLLQLLSDETRLSLVLWLAQGESSVSELCAELKLPQSTVSHHLGLLRLAGLVQSRRQGRQVYYHINQVLWRRMASSFFDHLPEGEVRRLTLDRFVIQELP